MKSKKLVSLAVLAVVLGTIAYYTSKGDHKKPAIKPGTPLFEDLSVNEIAEIHISQETESITLSRTDSGWICPEKQGHPVKFDAIRAMILKIADMKIGHLTPADEQQRQEIGMILPPAKGSGTLVEMRNSQGDIIETLLIGTTKESPIGVGMMRYPTGCFVSDDQGKSVYLTKDTFSSVSPSPRAWLDSKLLNIERSEIKAISIEYSDGKSLNLTKVDGALKPDKLAKDETTDTSAVNSLAYLLSNLSFDDLAEPGTTEGDMGFSDPVTLTAETENGVEYTLKIGNNVKGKAERYARLSAEFKHTVEETSEVGTSDLTEEQIKKAEQAKKTKESELNELKEEISELNNRFSKWTYTLATHKTDSVTLANENIITKNRMTQTNRNKE